jgi:hypothetical protein
MLAEVGNLINEAVLVGLLLFGFYLAAVNMRTFLFPQRTGRIISIGQNLSDGGDGSCKSCALMPTEPGRSTIPLSVRLGNGDVCNAEISPCCVCIDRMKAGDYVGITKFGSRTIVQKISRLNVMGG